ncbi:hypothetical protein DPMN_163069 [Dreissena polymorpha]|uniref:Reverse transcriptase n=1 Tax=Dreissena polymorpha TaxID=45954 RepID=A0A9D4ERF4_DREPO|nr:hypothetical protein DPMN_163069 [Dreissena polymorpha]
MELTTDPTCKLCGRPANLESILYSCRTALTSRRFRWRHDKIFSDIAANLDVARTKKPLMQTMQTFINYVKEGEQSQSNNKSTNSTNSGSLASASDW